MKLLFVSLIVLAALMEVGVKGSTAQDYTDEFATNAVQQNQNAITTCVVGFSEESIAVAATLLRIQKKGPANLDSEGAHRFAAEYYHTWCSLVDCSDVVQQVNVCAQLSGYSFSF